MYSIININKKVKWICPYFAKKNSDYRISLLKPLFKYPITLFILLSTGYSQVFAHLYRTNFPYSRVKQMLGLEHFHAPLKTSEKEDIYFEEEENRRVSLKEFSKDNIYASFFYADFPGYFFERLQSHTFFCRYFSRFSLFGSPEPEFSVLRL